MSAPDPGTAVPRRAVLAAGGGAAVCAVAAACGSGPASGPASGAAAPTAAPPPAGAPAPSAPPPPGSGSASSAASDGLRPPQARAPRPVAATTDIPLGGGRVFPELRVVVTQPAAGVFRGFGIVCTHDQCELTAVAGGTINCPCHGSRFAVTDGSVVRGPARTGLRTERLAVDGGEILLL